MQSYSVAGRQQHYGQVQSQIYGASQSMMPQMPQMGGALAQPHMGMVHGQPQMADAFGQPQMGSVYGQAQMASAFGQPQMGSVYGQPQMASPFGQPHMASVYIPPQMSSGFADAQMAHPMSHPQIGAVYGQSAAISMPLYQSTGSGMAPHMTQATALMGTPATPIQNPMTMPSSQYATIPMPQPSTSHSTMINRHFQLELRAAQRDRESLYHQTLTDDDSSYLMTADPFRQQNKNVQSLPVMESEADRKQVTQKARLVINKCIAPKYSKC